MKESGSRYSFRGAPDFARLIAENPGADMIHVEAGNQWQLLLLHETDPIRLRCVEKVRGVNGLPRPHVDVTRTTATKNWIAKPAFQLCLCQSGGITLPDGWVAVQLCHPTSQELAEIVCHIRQIPAQPRVIVTPFGAPN